MRKIWLVALNTYLPRVRSGSFLFLTFALPAFMVIAGAIPLIQATGSLPPVGYVDQTGRLAPVSQVSVEGGALELTAFSDVEQARAALDRGRIAGYLVVPSDYFDGATASYYGSEQPGARLQEGLTRFMQRALLAGRTADWQLDRLQEVSSVTYVDRDTGDEVGGLLGIIVRFVAPAVLGIVFALALLTGVSQMGTAMAREKDQRAMEMIITSLAPWQLVAGKVLGLALLTGTQLAIWVGGGAVAILLALAGAPEAAGVSLPWADLGWGAVLGVLAYFLYAVTAAGLGVIAGDRQQARQLAGLLGFLGMAPLYLMSTIIVPAPDGPLAVALTLFPFTAPTVGLIRMVLTDVPVTQLVLSAGILAVSLAVSVWFVARIFRAAMLLYGQSMTPRQIARALRRS
jgi:ABC-2 type transport system permease protein